MYYLNKIVWFFLNPVMVSLAVGLLALIFRRRWIGALALIMLWLESTLSCVCLLGIPLEREGVMNQKVETLPPADAVVVLGGGIGKCSELAYPDLYEAADRAWHAARIYKAGKAPVVVVSGSGELESTVPFLVDLGVKRESIMVDNESRNTYENSRFTERLLGKNHRVLLVTSAWHMPRALGNFSKTSLQVTPAPSDFTTYNALNAARHWWEWFNPNADNLARTSYLFKEWIGKLARK